jgi:hypothetical protein
MEDPVKPGSFLRPRDGELGEEDRHQHAAFLDDLERRPALHRERIDSRRDFAHARAGG